MFGGKEVNIQPTPSPPKPPKPIRNNSERSLYIYPSPSPSPSLATVPVVGGALPRPPTASPPHLPARDGGGNASAAGVVVPVSVAGSMQKPALSSLHNMSNASDEQSSLLAWQQQMNVSKEGNTSRLPAAVTPVGELSDSGTGHYPPPYSGATTADLLSPPPPPPPYTSLSYLPSVQQPSSSLAVGISEEIYNPNEDFDEHSIPVAISAPVSSYNYSAYPMATIVSSSSDTPKNSSYQATFSG